eukprot:48260_1
MSQGLFLGKGLIMRTLLVSMLICIVLGGIFLSIKHNELFDFFVDKPMATVLVPEIPLKKHTQIFVANHLKYKPRVNDTHIKSSIRRTKTPTKPPKRRRKKLYSSFMCLGGDTNKKINNYRKFYNYELTQHTCHFKNICYSNQRKQWLYYAPPLNQSLPEIIQTEQFEIHHDFNTASKGFLIAHAMGHIPLTPIILHQSFPNTNRMDYMFNRTVVYHYLQWVYNFGHVLTDNYYSMYRALYYFHLYTHNECCQSLFNFEWQAGGFETGRPIKLSVKFINDFNTYLFNNSKPLFLGYDSERMHDRHLLLENITDALFENDDSERDLACFKNIVLGTDDFRIWHKGINRKFHHRWDFSNFMDLFRKNVLHRDRYNKYLKVEKQKILFISKGKGERRQWTQDTNISYIVQYLEGLFGVEIDSMEASEIYNGKSLTQQIDFIIPYTLVITACGAVSYIGAFMRSGTAMITVDYWYIPGNVTTHIDSYLWEYMNDRKTYYYYVRQDEWEIPAPYRRKHGSNTLEDVRNNADYRLKAPRMSKYVYAALLWIEHYNGWTDTFTKPLNFPIDDVD